MKLYWIESGKTTFNIHSQFIRFLEQQEPIFKQKTLLTFMKGSHCQFWQSSFFLFTIQFRGWVSCTVREYTN